ncbi:MAG: hypothetical protein ABIN67_20650 [Ferruginibacter sp.]
MSVAADRSLNGLHAYNFDEYEQNSFAPILAESQKLSQKINKIFKASNDIDAGIAGIANKGDYNLLLMGYGQSIFEGSLLGKILGFTSRIINPGSIYKKVRAKEKCLKTRPGIKKKLILSKTEVPVGIFMDKNFYMGCRIGNFYSKMT